MCTGSSVYYGPPYYFNNNIFKKGAILCSDVFILLCCGYPQYSRLLLWTLTAVRPNICSGFDAAAAVTARIILAIFWG